jgi:hypothetical protein
MADPVGIERKFDVVWSAEDGEYLGLCSEFPSLSWLAPSAKDALAGIRKLVHDAASDRVAPDSNSAH